MSSQKKKGMNLERKQNLTGWAFLMPATILIAWMSFYPMIQAFILSLQTGMGINLKFNGFANYARILKDPTFKQTLSNTFFYLIIQVPIMLILGLMFASMLNNKDLRFKGLFRTCIFLPCATSLVSYAMIFRSLFANDGFINTVLRGLGMNPIMWFSNAWTARAVIIIALIWRWTGYNMVFYLSGMQNIEYSIYEAARIDGASNTRVMFSIVIPLLKPIIIFTVVQSSIGMFNLFTEPFILTNSSWTGGINNGGLTLMMYLLNKAPQGGNSYGYASACAYVITIMIVVISVFVNKFSEEKETGRRKYGK